MAGKAALPIAFGCVDFAVFGLKQRPSPTFAPVGIFFETVFFVSLTMTNQTALSAAHSAGPVVSTPEPILRISLINTAPSGNWPVSRNALTASGCV
jgi:hypothetical protein